MLFSSHVGGAESCVSIDIRLSPGKSLPVFIVFTNLLFHKGCDPSSKINLSKNYTNSVENFLFLNGGYHTIHHLYPRLHWSQLPQMHDKHIAPFIKKELVLNSMVIDTYQSYFKKDLFKEGLYG